MQTARDELLVLSATFSSMAQQLFNREKRLSARASLSSILASSIDAEQLASEALREIAKYANCEIGLVYIHNPKTNALRRVGTHSLDDAPQTIKVGDGILGEAAASRRTVLVRDIPTDAPFQVRFGFDQVPPKTIVAVPMVCQDQLVGAMLLGGLRDLSDDAVSFTETSVYQLGLSLQVALAHEQVQMLAANLQEKNEELQAQSEEIQAQNEEIQTQNEELQRQNEELQAQAEEIQAQSDELSKQNEEIEAQRKHLIERNDELARLRQTAEAEKQNLQIIIDSMPEGVVICDAEGRITITNKAADELYRRPVPYGAPVDEYAEDLQLYRPDGTLYPSLELPLARSALQSETLKGVEMIIKWPTGEQKPLLCNTAPLFDHEGALAGAVGVFQDISALKEIEHLKDEFLSVASHELKSPLTSLKGFAQILHERVRPTQLYEEFRVPLQIIDSQVDKVVWLVNRLLDVSRVQMGRLEMKPQRINLAELVSKQVDQARVKSEKHQWVLDVQDDVVGYWDPGYIEQVVTNLLDNAIRYSPNGGEIRVSMRRADGKAYLSVADQGIGIAPEALSNLFKRYYRSEGAKRISAEGMGIGLYVTHAIVDAHGGRIWVDSEPGKGSTFSVELPLSQFTIQSS
ncbi:MAG: ATP-binding protein [Chloroflexi bacterium]|nr:ATP-binding protein [Chloroflexota bacterium]